jgi:hypothetical protein
MQQLDPMQILQFASAGLGALYLLTLVVNVFNPLIALRWPRFAAVLSTMGGHVADARAELGAIKLARRAPAMPPLPLLALALLLGGCTAAQVKGTVIASLDGGETACQALETQPEPNWVTFACTVITIADGTSHVFTMKVPKEQAAAFSAKKCKPAEGSVSP